MLEYFGYDKHCYGKLADALFFPLYFIMVSSTLSQKIHLDQDDSEALKKWIKAQALELGFSDCVIAKPDAQAELERFKEYLKRGYHGDMKFL